MWNFQILSQAVHQIQQQIPSLLRNLNKKVIGNQIESFLMKKSNKYIISIFVNWTSYLILFTSPLQWFFYKFVKFVHFFQNASDWIYSLKQTAASALYFITLILNRKRSILKQTKIWLDQKKLKFSGRKFRFIVLELVVGIPILFQLQKYKSMDIFCENWL